MSLLLFVALAAAQATPAPAAPAATTATPAAPVSLRAGTATVAQLYADPAAQAVLLKHIPEIAQYMDYIGGSTLVDISKQYPDRLSADAVASIDADLAALPKK